jgi:hypothetical protein
MLEWMVPVLLFWAVAPLYFGGMAVDIKGGSGLRQVLGLFLTYALFLVVWGLLHSLVGRAAGTVPGLLVATVVAILGLPIEARVGFRLVGARVQRTAELGH